MCSSDLVSNLYLLKELDDDGVACAMYAYSITDGVIDDETLEKLRKYVLRIYLLAR